MSPPDVRELLSLQTQLYDPAADRRVIAGRLGYSRRTGVQGQPPVPTASYWGRRLPDGSGEAVLPEGPDGAPTAEDLLDEIGRRLFSAGFQ